MKKQKGFSLVEVAIVLVIIGVIIGAVAVANETKTVADVTKMYKKRVESCLAVAYGVGSSEKYDGSETDRFGSNLKNFCQIIKKDGITMARIYVPSKDLTVLLYEKTLTLLSPDDFMVQSNVPRKTHFDVTMNDGFGLSPIFGPDGKPPPPRTLSPPPTIGYGISPPPSPSPTSNGGFSNASRNGPRLK